MILKPRKSYGVNTNSAILFKRFIVNEKVNVLYQFNAEKTKYYAGVINGILYGVYSINTDTGEITKLSYVEGITEYNNNNCIVFKNLNEVAYVGNKFITLKKVKSASNVQNNTSEYEVSDSYKGELMSRYAGVEIDDSQKNKYYKMCEFMYVAENDIEHVEAQYVKGNTMRYRTMSIRWDDYAPISKGDIVVIENIPFVVGDITESRRYAPRLIQTYRTELMQYHV